MNKKETERAEAIECLRKNYGIKPGTRIYTSVSNVAASGMSRHIHVHVMCRGKRRADDRVLTISGLVGRAIGVRRSDKTGGLVMGGCGMDLGYQVVYLLGHALFPRGGKISDSVRHYSGKATSDPGGNNLTEPNGGYLLKHRWL